MVPSLNVSAIRTCGIPTSYSSFERQPAASPNHRLIGVLLKAGGPRGTEFTMDVTEALTYEAAICSLGQINSRMELYQVPTADLEKCFAGST